MPHDDFHVEPVPGLPERPPEGEQILWQGRPNWWALTVQSLNLYWVAGYFVLLFAWRFVTLFDQVGMAHAFRVSFPFLIIGAVAAALLLLIGYVQARATVYTITNRRVAMRVGAALTVTLNLPFSRIASADLALRRSGNGTIALDLMDPPPLSYLTCWPHVRPWHVRKPQPALRSIDDAARIARLIADTAEAQLNAPKLARTPTAAETTGADDIAPGAVPAE
ncbi:photosynthetic complex putative assembly protein PuhB [Roseovarius sp.]|uniref:photosynthetic complex putative assembly protein PuhB n=1 Tax=Roseovarius sp. TaxID=1486281 RepID=UPI003D0E5358